MGVENLHFSRIEQPNTTEKLRPHRVETFRELSAIQKEWMNNITPDQNGADLLRHAKGEVQELQDAIGSNDRQEIASEIADVFIFFTQISEYYGIPLDIAITDKVQRNDVKYSKEDLDILLSDGKSFDEARTILKSRWDKSRDKKEFSHISPLP